MLRCLAVLFALALPGATMAADGLDPAATERCVAWMKERPSSAPAEVRTVAPDTLCADFTSSLTSDSRDAFLTPLANIPADIKPQVIVRSLGGDVELGMDMGDAILDRKASVHAYQVCVSSCANYLFLPAHTRHVMADSVVLFHGGIVPRMKNLPDVTAEGRQRLQRNIERQDAFLRRASIYPQLFEWMDRLNQPNLIVMRHCPTDRKITLMQLSDAVLAGIGAPVSSNEGPRSQQAVDALVARYGPAMAVCYWDHPVKL
ncbi:hypothetical protein [Stenotrophomonas sp.]|uniref:hypothetical protein n=1 Tax=Stenotrophomonas sp. TaxID=69392 RepID=UPI002D3B2146|nr:hypothetical protein [Stenotrophomonas sp.]HYQ23048.1 hypothetical protein [Stenotrophomonas sp.]